MVESGKEGAVKRSELNLPVVIAALVAAIVVVAAVFVFALLRAQDSHDPDMVTVGVNIVAPSHNDATDSKIPLRVVGTRASGAAVDYKVYATSSDATIDVAPGTYTIDPIASPLLESGDFYELPDSVPLVVDDDGNAQSDDIVFEVKPPADITDDEIDAAVDEAIESGYDETKAHDLADDIREARDNAAQEDIYPWVVVKRTNSGSSGAVEYVYDYDDAGRLVSITGQQEELNANLGMNARAVQEVTLGYDDAGNLISIAPGAALANGTIAIEYGNDGKVSGIDRQWTIAGRFPDAGSYDQKVDFTYDSDGALATSASTTTSDTQATASESREYGKAEDASYAYKATSDGSPSLVEWNDTQVMAGNGMNTGALGELDEYGNLVRAEADNETTVTYEYAQIAVKRSSWKPNALSNPTLRTFAYDGLASVNYLTFFPPQLTDADADRVLKAETINRGSTEDAGAQKTEASAEPDGAHLDTAYYTIDLPESYGDVQLDYSSEIGGSGPLLIGYTTHATLGGEELFEVSCYSNDWGPEGWYSSVKVGTTSLEGLDVYLMVPWSDPGDQQAAQARVEEFAPYITVV